MRTVVIVEPHPLFRLGLRQLLADVIPNASVEGYDYSALDSQQGSSTDSCELLLLSVMPNHSVRDLVSKAVARFSPARTLLLTENGDTREAAQDMPACVNGAVNKEAPPELMHASVRLVMAGGTCFPLHQLGVEPVRVAPVAVNALLSTPPSDAKRYAPVRWAGPQTSANVSEDSAVTEPAANGAEGDCEFSPPMKPGSAAHKESQLLGLTPRQYEVLVLLARGYPMKKVGRALNISVATAKAHTETLYQRLDVHNRNAAVYAAVSRGATLGWANVTQPAD